MNSLRHMVAALDRSPVQSRANLAAMGGDFYRIGDEEWCDTAGASYRRVGADRWETSDFSSMAQPGMNTGEGESPESSDSVFAEGCGFESHWEEVSYDEREEEDFIPACVPDVVP